MFRSVTSRRCAFALSLLMLFTLFAARTPAQLPQTSKDRLTRALEPDSDVEPFRRELSDYLSDWEETIHVFNSIPLIARKWEAAGFKPAEALAEVKLRVAQLNYSDLAQLRAVYSRTPGWREVPRTISARVSKPELRQQLAARDAGLQSEAGKIVPALVADDCALAISADITNSDISILEAAVLTAESVMELLPTDGITIVAREIPTGLWIVARGLLLAAQTFKNIADDCSDDTFQTEIKQQLTNTKNDIVNNDNANKTTIVNNDNANKTEIVNNDNANKTTIINNNNANKTEIINNDNANAAMMRDLLLRTQIEADLAAPDSAVPVGLFVTPSTQCAGSAPVNQCGMLDFVRQIVVQTISRLAGSSAAQANAFLAKGDQYKAASNYKAAYQEYRKAYKAATG
jgi:hypothetical protein